MTSGDTSKKELFLVTVLDILISSCCILRLYINFFNFKAGDEQLLLLMEKCKPCLCFLCVSKDSIRNFCETPPAEVQLF